MRKCKATFNLLTIISIFVYKNIILEYYNVYFHAMLTIEHVNCMNNNILISVTINLFINFTMSIAMV